VNEQIDFTATQLTGPNGQTIARYEWDFGDGSDGVNGRRAGHSYDVADNYNVSLITTEAVTGSISGCFSTIAVR
jgi:PKD repeat protein